METADRALFVDDLLNNLATECVSENQMRADPERGCCTQTLKLRQDR